MSDLLQSRRPEVTGAGPQPRSPVVLAVTGEDHLAERLAGLAATAGVALRRSTRWAGHFANTSTAALVLVGTDVDPAPSRRSGLVIVCEGDPPPSVWRQAVEIGAEQVAVLPEAESWLLDRMVDAASPARLAPIIGVIGGRGGAGASAVAVALAAAAVRSAARTLLVDGDPLGGGLDLMVGLEQEPGLRWPDLASARGRLQPGLLSTSLPVLEELSVLSWDRGLGAAAGSGPDAIPGAVGARAGGGPVPGCAGRELGRPAPALSAGPVVDADGWVPAPQPGEGEWEPAEPAPPWVTAPIGVTPAGVRGSMVRCPDDASGDGTPAAVGAGPLSVPAAAVEAVLRAASREFDLVVVDLSRRFAAADLAAARSCGMVFVVVPAEVRATAAAARVYQILDGLVADTRLLVRGPAPGGLSGHAVADALGVRLSGEFRAEPSLAAALDRGENLPTRPRGLTVLSRRLIAQVLAA